MRTAYSERKRHSIKFADRGKTVQYFKEECDINNILKKHQTQNVLWQTSARPQYGDFTDIPDYQDALNRVQAANESFLALPAEIRRQFGNDPAVFVEYCSNKDNLEELRRMGLAPEAQQIPEEILSNEGTKPAE